MAAPWPSQHGGPFGLAQGELRFARPTVANADDELRGAGCRWAPAPASELQ
jgi:hypothetical protein